MASKDEIAASFSGAKKVQQLRALDLQLSSAFRKGTFHNQLWVTRAVEAMPMEVVSADKQWVHGHPTVTTASLAMHH